MFPYAAAILAVWLVWAIIVPAIDSAVSSDNPTAAGDRMQVTSTVSLAVGPDWNIDSGFRVGERGASDSLPAVVLTQSGITFAVEADKFSGTADELLSQIDAVDSATYGQSVLALSGSREPVTTEGGLSGVQIRFDTPRAAGSVTTFVARGDGIRVQVVGPPDQLANRGQEIDAMIDSVGTTEGDAR
ncbi:hypothetical protein [Williamsia sp. 1135]|uniref:hypothetical protein n=1 Tax=Williamsia sp. 1135 TaxID=1889262 RepID=UPI000A0FEE63|nr:hypothetical protein [Williamsia sp. 1135]ORM35161.1 hypothetical protein BFL43_10195 [Williamsia sp. 1135]